MVDALLFWLMQHDVQAVMSIVVPSANSIKKETRYFSALVPKYQPILDDLVAHSLLNYHHYFYTKDAALLLSLLWMRMFHFALIVI